MIEAVNSVLANASLLRASAGQGESELSAERVAIQSAELSEASVEAPQAPFVSPYIEVDVNFNTAVLQIRDSDTGDVLRQFPSEEALLARQRTDSADSQQVTSERAPSRPIQVEAGTSGDQAPVGVSFASLGAQQSTAGSEPSFSGSAQAQVAAAALASGSLAGQQTSSGVNIAA